MKISDDCKVHSGQIWLSIKHEIVEIQSQKALELYSGVF
jgi:hypothetical protein